MPGPTQGMGQQNGDCHVGGTQLAEVKAWEFTPTQKCGSVVTNATGGFEGQILGGIGGAGSVTLVVPKTGYSTPPQFGATPILNLYADAAKVHGFTQMPIAVEKASVKSISTPPTGSRSASTSRPTGRTTPRAPSPSSARTTMNPRAAAELRGKGCGVKDEG